MSVLENIQPTEVMRYFEQIAQIPHGSRNTKAISDYLVLFAKSHDLKYRQDNMNNVIIWKDASEGSEDKEPVIIQGHMDMVCEVNPANTKIDMSKDPIDLYVEGDEIRAKDTTLGGDDGIAIAMALAILADEELKHPPIEAIFTVDEEIGMLGAAGIDISDVKGHTMLNIDSEDEGIFTVSCAGGVVAKCVLPINNTKVQGPVMQVMVSGLTGGHSGVEIIKNRANACVLLGRVLQAISERFDIRIRELKGGSKDNAIPINAEAQIVLAGLREDQTEDLLSRAVQIASDITKELKNEYSSTDSKMMIVCRPVFKSIQAKDVKGKFIFDTVASDAATSSKILYMLNCLPNGIQRMSPDNNDFVRTSLNMGILEKNDKCVITTHCLRSSVASEKENLKMRLRTGMKAVGGNVIFHGEYPGWEYREQSPIRDLMTEVYKEQYNEEPKIEAIHAGVECGFFADKIKDIDCISFGPNLKNIHTFNESMNIPSVQRVYKMLLEVIARLA